MTETRNLTLIDNLVPSVAAGDHTISVTQTPSGGDIPNGTKFELTQELTVTGLRLRVEANEIHGAYPPAGTAGQFAQYLPHVALERRGVPWERKIASSDDGTTPWLAVLLFAQGELPNDPKALGATEDGTAESLLLSGGDSVSLPDYSAVSELSEEEKKQPIATIRVPKAVFTRVAPKTAELPFLTHIRTPLGTEENDTARRAAEYAYVMANRFPEPTGGRYVAHLVSFEGHKAVLDSPATAKDHIRLVSLHHWSFVSTPIDTKAAYPALRTNLTQGAIRPHLLQHPGPDKYGANEHALDDYAKHTRYLIETGHVALGHIRADRPGAYAFYRGPLTPYPVASAPHSGKWWEAEEDSFGVESVGYHAAWTLARGLALADQEFAAALARTLDLRYTVARNVVQIVHGRQAVAAELEQTEPNVNLTEAVGKLLPAEDRLHLPIHEALVAANGAGESGENEPDPDWWAGAHALDRVLAGEPPQFHAPALLGGLAPTGVVGDEEDAPEIDLVSMVRAGDLTFPAAAPPTTAAMGELTNDPQVLRRFAAHVLGHTSEAPSADVSAEASPVGTVPDAPAPVASLEPGLTAFLNGLRLLQRVPFDYLVPDARALPTESMRWFRVDSNWLDALVYGALWAGICGAHDRTAVEALIATYLAASPPTPKSGLIIRSRLVADYPEVGIEPSKEQVSGPDLDSPQVLRRAKLAPDVLLLLFDGVPKEVHVTEPDQGVHLGVATHDGTEKITLRALKKVDTTVIGDEILEGRGSKRVAVAFRSSTRVLNIAGSGNLLDTIWTGLGGHKDTNSGARETLSPGEFGLQLVRSPEKAILHTPTTLRDDQGDDEGAHS